MSTTYQKQKLRRSHWSQNNHASHSCPSPPWSAPASVINRTQPVFTQLTALEILTASCLPTLSAQFIHSCCLWNPVKVWRYSPWQTRLRRGAALCVLRELLAHWRTAARQQRDKDGDPTPPCSGGGGGQVWGCVNWLLQPAWGRGRVRGVGGRTTVSNIG